MSDAAIRVEGLSKRYSVGERESYRTLRDTLAQIALAPSRLFSRNAQSRNGHRAFWALKDVSFEVKPGEVIGIIGRNGAGKSTLLKILSRITTPTKGFAEINGRVGSLLEVGTGFHPELTGRENIYLNGAILGMRKAEIERKFDEIVAFAEVENFIDTPVKRFSSGMFVRLAFAVAVHLEPEILIIDEVLAVGDAQFQKKCFEKMRAIGREHRTILFVSHNIAALRTICNRGIILEHGRMLDEGEINYIADKYLAQLGEQHATEKLIETESFILNDVEIKSANGNAIKTFDPVEIRVTFTAKEDIREPGVYVGLLTLDNQRLAGLDFADFETVPRINKGERGRLGFSINSLPLLPGDYQIEIHLKDHATSKFEFVAEQFPFEVIEAPVYGGRKINSWFGLIGLKATAKHSQE